MASLVKNIIGGFVALIIGVTIAPPLADAIFVSTQGGNTTLTNLTTTDNTLLELVITLFVIAILMAAVNLV